MIMKVHKATAALSLLLIASFWISSAAAELSGSVQAIIFAKCFVLAGVFMLASAMAATGLTGRRLAGSRSNHVLSGKLTRIKVMAACGIALLIPLAIYLWWKATSGEFDEWFYAAQLLEFAAGAVNLLLGAMNVSAGVSLRRRRLAPKAA
jgi:hypothetical protein